MATLVRLRPVVHASPTPTGLHVRGWASSFSMDGGTGLWKVWQRLAVPLAQGVSPEELTVPAGAPPAVAAAVKLILEQLREHDMLVEVPPEWGAQAPPERIAAWLESVSGNPWRAWQRLRAARISVTGPDRLAAYALRAVESAGLTAELLPGKGLTVAAGDLAVAGDCGADGGFVVAPGTPLEVEADAREVAHRLGLAAENPAEVIEALVAGAAVHRLLCAAGGLPDPASEFVVHQDQAVPEPVGRQVLVARLDPLRAAYHPWLSSARPTAAPADPLRVLDALADPELGPVPAPRFAALPQVPAKLALCGEALGVGTTADAARLDAIVAALPVPPGAVAGIDRTQALGSALRLAARELHGGERVAEGEWAADPTARRWWKALTLRFAIPARLEVIRLSPFAVRAEVHAPQGVLAWAVEARAADAVAFAALAATGRAQAAMAGTAHLNGAAPLAVPGGEQPSWAGREWHWPAGLRAGEEEFQARLAELTEAGSVPDTWVPVPS